VGQYEPDVVINTAAYTAVDRAETEAMRAFAVNASGPKNLAEAAKVYGFKLVHISTDFVFNGQRFGKPYRPNDATEPLGVYGLSKLQGERWIRESTVDSWVILRTAWLYSSHHHNFVRTILKLLLERDEIAVVSDQTGSPTWARSLADTIWTLAGFSAGGDQGILHWVDAGEVTWYEFARAIQEDALEVGILSSRKPIRASTSAQYGSLAPRPKYSVLDCVDTIALTGKQQQPWRDCLRQTILEIAAQGPEPKLRLGNDRR
jgi:dTDP-4-dehydrorhamnose reductase